MKVLSLLSLLLFSLISIPAEQPLFVESAGSTGLAFTYVSGATGQYYMPEIMGSGAARPHPSGVLHATACTRVRP